MGYLETPLDDQQRPSRDSAEGYKAPSIQPGEGLDSIESLRTWAQARCDIHLPVVKRSMSKNSKITDVDGSGADLDDELMKMAYATIDFHLTEVERCLQMNGGPKLRNLDLVIVQNGLHPMAFHTIGTPHTLLQPQVTAH